jgi:SAM-dependent methyltransferase
MPPLPPLTLNAWMRYDVIRRALAPVPPGSTVLEIGAGQGAVGARLARRYLYTGVEPDPGSAKVARARIEAAGGRFKEATADALPDSERFHVVCAFEVLEHLEDDVDTLRSWVARLQPGGLLVLSVPAFQSRFAAADRSVGHYRRYDPELLRRRLEEAGLINVALWITGFPFGLLLEHGRNLLAMLRPTTDSMESRTLESGRWYQPPAALGWTTAVVTLPFRWMQRPFLRTRLGTGIVARATRPLGEA